jgi:hypothetical protein
MSMSQADPGGTASRKLLYAGIVIFVGVLATTLAQDVVLAKIPLQNLLKNTLHADRSANAAFFFWISIPWYVKPLIGMYQDAVPVFGSRRRSYLMIGGAVAAVCWFALTFVPVTYRGLLGICLVISTAMVIASTAIGGYMVEAARDSGGPGRLTSLRYLADQVSVLCSGPGGGFLGTLALAWTGVACGTIAFLIVPAAWLFMRERTAPVATGQILAGARAQLRAIGSAHTMWAAAGFAALFYSAPGVATAVFYIQQNDLHMSTQNQGFLTFLSGSAGLVAAALYGGLAVRRLTLRTLLLVCLVAGAIGNLAYWFYGSVAQASIAETVNGFGYTLAEVAIMHLAVRATPKGSEALGFSLIISVRNFCLYGSDWIGAAMIDRWHLAFHHLVAINAATTLLAVPLVLLLPKAITMVRDVREPDPAIDLAPPPPHTVHE